MQAATTQRQAPREKGTSLSRVFVSAGVVAALVLAFAPGAFPESRSQNPPSAGVLLPAPPRMARWGQRPAVPTGRAKLDIHRQIELSPRPCSPSLYSAPNTGMNEGTTNSFLPLRPGARASAVMLFVDFPDLHASESPRTIYEHLVPRARRWYAEVSYGRLRLEVTPVSRWLRMPRRLRAYGLRDGLSFDEQQAFIADAVAAADRAVDFSGYQLVYVVAAKGTGVERSPAFHAYPGSGVTADGTELRYGATFFEDTKADARGAANVLIHETGHILGLPDLYDVVDPGLWSPFRFTGGWDIMSSLDPGSHFLAWEKWKLGWLEPSQKAIVLPTGPSSALVVEARRRIGQDGRLCREGVLIYTVDASVRSGSGPVRVHAAQPDRSADLRDRCGPLYNAPFAREQGRVARFEDTRAGIAVKVLRSGLPGYRVRVTRR